MNDLDIKVEETIENACEWIEALAADDFEQTREKMTHKGGFCCLGVGALLCGAKESLGGFTFARGEHELLGLYYENGQSVRGSKEPALVKLNDDYLLTFPEIATMILRNPYVYLKPVVAEGVEDYFFNNGDQ